MKRSWFDVLLDCAICVGGYFLTPYLILQVIAKPDNYWNWVATCGWVFLVILAVARLSVDRVLEAIERSKK